MKILSTNVGSKKSFYIFAFDKRLISLFEISIYNICMHAQRIHYQPLIMDTTTNKRESNNVYYQTDVTENITCEEYDRKRHPLFQTETLAKDQSVSYNRIDCSALVFVMEGTVRVSTATYLQDVVEEGNMFVVHELDSVCIRGVEDAVMIYCLFYSSMALCNGLSLKSFSTPPGKDKTATIQGQSAHSAHTKAIGFGADSDTERDGEKPVRTPIHEGKTIPPPYDASQTVS